MKKSKRSKWKKPCKSGDLLSKLPDKLIFHIFSSLPIRDVVRTTILSHRWKNLWTKSPCLRIEECKKQIYKYRIQNLVNRALMLWKGVRLEKFTIDLGTHDLNKSLYRNIDLWLRFAEGYSIQELDVNLEYDISPNDGDDAMKGAQAQEELYCAPYYLYSCSWLEKLCLKGCNLCIPTNDVRWNRLKYLRIEGGVLSQVLINKVLRGSPKLEVLVLSCHMEKRESLTIQSSSLKRLFVEKYLYYDENDDASADTELRISAPNLEFLDMRGGSYRKCLMDASTVLNLEQVVLSDSYIKVLDAMIEEYMHSLSLNVKLLELRYCRQEYEEIVDFLQMFPNLRNLVVESTYKGLRKDFKSCVEFDRILTDSFLLRLRRVEVTWTDGDESIFPLIEILLKYGRNLEKMILREKQIEWYTSWKSLFRSSQKLQRMHRSSPTVELIFC